MPLNTVTTGNTILNTDINQLVNVLQRAGGQTETGGYYLNGWSGASGDNISAWIGSLSRGATPVSVSIDTSTQSPVNCNSPTTEKLDANGFHALTSSTVATVSAYCGGHYTIQY